MFWGPLHMETMWEKLLVLKERKYDQSKQMINHKKAFSHQLARNQHFCLEKNLQQQK